MVPVASRVPTPPASVAPAGLCTCSVNVSVSSSRVSSSTRTAIRAVRWPAGIARPGYSHVPASRKSKLPVAVPEWVEAWKWTSSALVLSRLTVNTMVVSPSVTVTFGVTLSTGRLGSCATAAVVPNIAPSSSETPTSAAARRGAVSEPRGPERQAEREGSAPPL